MAMLLDAAQSHKPASPNASALADGDRVTRVLFLTRDAGEDGGS